MLPSSFLTSMDAMEYVLSVMFIVGLTYLARPLVRYAATLYKFRNIEGPRGLPFFGHVFALGKDSETFFKVMKEWCERYRQQGFFVRYMGMTPYIIVFNADDMEKILSNTTIEKKGYLPDFRKWLGDGLLMSTGPKWVKRRKLLTPSFHFSILNKFLHVFNEQAECLTEKLCKMADGRTVDVAPLVTMCTVDIICETIMGLKLETQKGEGSQYLAALERFGILLLERFKSPWYGNDFIYSLTSQGKEMAKCLEILHNTTKKMIRERKQQTMTQDEKEIIIDDPSRDVRERRRLAFLDLLIEAQKQDPTLTDEGIQEEVDTFMFEGHDTVSSSIAFCLYGIGRHPKVQKKIHAELDQVFGEGDCMHMTQDKLARLEYLNCVIKESLRMFTPVPTIGRLVDEEFHACGVTIPPEMTIVSSLFNLHRDPKYFPNPEVFDPDRFLPENSADRPNFAFVPFSAGHRNCIGQKFAQLELKVVLATILRNLKVQSLQKMEDLRLTQEIVLRSADGIKMTFKIRSEVGNE